MSPAGSPAQCVWWTPAVSLASAVEPTANSAAPATAPRKRRGKFIRSPRVLPGKLEFQSHIFLVNSGLGAVAFVGRALRRLKPAPYRIRMVQLQALGQL